MTSYVYSQPSFHSYKAFNERKIVVFRAGYSNVPLNCELTGGDDQLRNFRRQPSNASNAPKGKRVTFNEQE